jgi:excisionase family DNA binding protein
MKNQHQFPRPVRPSGESDSIEKRFEMTGRPGATEAGSVSSSREVNPMEMTAGGNDIAALVAALAEHTRAIGTLVATLAPEVPDLVGTEYLAKKLGVSKQWVGTMAERGDIPRHCVAPKVSGGRIWKFHRERVDAWLREREEG